MGHSLTQSDLGGKVTAGVKWLSKWTTCGIVLPHLLGKKRDILNLILYSTLDCSLGIVMDPSRLNSVSLKARVPWKDMLSHTVGLTSDHVWWILCLCAWLLPGNLCFPLVISCVWPPPAAPHCSGTESSESTEAMWASYLARLEHFNKWLPIIRNHLTEK